MTPNVNKTTRIRRFANARRKQSNNHFKAADLISEENESDKMKSEYVPKYSKKEFLFNEGMKAMNDFQKFGND